MQTILTATRTLLTIAVLTYSSYCDYKTREVSNKVWILFAPVAFILTFLEIFQYESSQLSFYGICVGLTTVIAVALFYSGAFGGADAKALMCLALALPFYPSGLVRFIPFEMSPISQILFPVTIFSNAVLLAAVTSLAMLAYNISWHIGRRKNLFEGDLKLEPIGKRILVMITGYQVSISNLKEKWHVYPLEDIEENTDKGFKRKLVILPKDEGRKEIVERLDTAIKQGAIQNQVWATPGLPMLIFVTVGLVIALFFGDIIWIGIHLLFA